MMHYFDYALIKYMPNPKRGEIINIGLIVSHQELMYGCYQRRIKQLY